MSIELVVYFYTNDNDEEQQFVDDNGRIIFVNKEFLLSSSLLKTKRNVKNFLIISDKHKNEFDLFMKTSSPIKNSHFFIGSLEEGINEYENKKLEKYPYTYKNFTKDSDFSSEENFFLNLNPDTEEYIHVLFECLCEMLEAGYHKEENTKKIPDWIVSWDTDSQSKFLELFRYKTCYANNIPENDFGTAVFTWKEIFLTNKKFRKLLCENLIVLFEHLIIKYKFFQKGEYNMQPDFWLKNRKKISDKILSNNI
jgi:hypothetical protein